MAERLIFMGSDPIALPALQAIADGRCGRVEIAAVYTQPDRARGRGKKVSPNEIKLWSIGKGIPVRQPERPSKAMRLEIGALNADSVLVMAYGHLLSQALLETPRCGAWNLHTSLLPKYRGASPIQCAVANGDQETGVSLMRLARAMDAGPVLDVERVSIEEMDTALEVEAKLSFACVPLLERNLRAIHGGQAQPEAQDEALASYVRKLEKEDGELDFSSPASELARRINGLYPWPAARFHFNGVDIKIGLAAADEGPLRGEPGRVLGVEQEGLRIACGRGSLLLKRLQRPGGRMLEAAEFVRGFDLPLGMKLESRAMRELVLPRPHFERSSP